MRKLRAVLLTLLLAALAWSGESVTHPYAGVTYIERTETAPRNINLHIVLVDLRTPGIRFKLSPPGGTRECPRQSTLDFLKQEHAQIAINAHYFLPFPSPEADAFLIGLAASEGNVYSGFESPEQSYALLKDAPAFNIGRDNRVTVVHRDPAFEDGVHVLEHVTLWNVVSGSAQIVTDGAATIPEKEWYERINARTAIALTRDGDTLILFTVDARGGSAGMKVSEVATLLLRDYHAYQALNLDGGGSTTLAIGDRVVNTSSDNPNGRKVASSLALFASQVSTIQ